MLCVIGRGIEYHAVGSAFGEPAPGGEFRGKGVPGILFHGNPVLFRHQLVQIQDKEIGRVAIVRLGNNQLVILYGYTETTAAVLVCTQIQGLPTNLIAQKLCFNGDVFRAPVP